jgi:hypothetical protein
LSGLIDESQKEALRREREKQMPRRIAQHDEARERESIARRIRNSTRGGKQNE